MGASEAAASGRGRWLELAEQLLCEASRDHEWRERFERHFVGKGKYAKRLRGGAKVEHIWQSSRLIHKSVVDGLCDDPDMLCDFAGANLDVVSTAEHIEKWTVATANRLIKSEGAIKAFLVFVIGVPDAERATLKAFTITLEAAISYVESLGARDCAPFEESVVQQPDERLTAKTSSPAPGSAEKDSQIRELEIELKSVRKLRRVTLTEFTALQKRASAQAKTLEDLRSKQRASEASYVEASSQLRELRAERDELRRQVKKLERLGGEEQKGRTTIERALETRAEEFSREREDLSERLRGATTAATALEAQVAGLQATVQDERARRVALESLLESIGFSDLLSTSESFGTAIDTLVRFKEGVQAYSEQVRAEDRERRRKLEEAEVEKHRAEQARRAQQQAEQTWAHRTVERLREEVFDKEEKLYAEGLPDAILIDGHNLIHRSFRPDDEPSTREWLVRMVSQMADRMVEFAPNLQIRLCFDTKFQSNAQAISPNLTVYFQNNVNEGGADARIAALLREGNPLSRYLIVSTDIKHVWHNAIRGEQEEGLHVDLVAIEMLRNYLQTLDALYDAEESLSA